MDTLYYRFPNEDQQKQTGVFERITSNSVPNGFVVTDFLHQRIFAFKPNQENEIESNLHISDEAPFVISPRDYQIEAQALLNAFNLMGVQKAVYSRIKGIAFDAKKARQLFEELCRRHPAAFCYLISSAEFGTWIGATPELLLKQQGLQIETLALASTHRVEEEKEWSQKELTEHSYVVEAIAETLERNECFSIESNGPKEHVAGPVKHLKTNFSALLTLPNAWEIAMDLHPTPAVCGTPRMQALELIYSREMHERNLYTGIIGWFGESDCKLFVNLRCAQLMNDRAYLYLGGGFTSDSIPDLEWEETENKALTLIQAMDVVNN